MSDYVRNIVQIEETVEIFPNQSSHTSGKSVSFVVEADEVNASEGSLKEAVPSEPSSSTVFLPIRNCDKTVNSINPVDMEAPAVLQSKIHPHPPTEDASKCNICEYRSSIERWQFPDGLIFCPKCQHIEAPLLRTKHRKAKRSLRSTVCANCALLCWPLCFMPFLTNPPPQNFLHCPQCFAFLGLYDERKRCIQPNSEFVEYVGCFSAEESQRAAEKRWKEDVFMRQVY